MLVVILGRQPKLSLAELEARFGSKAVEPIGMEAALVDVKKLDFEQFGGLIRSAKLLARLKNHDFSKTVDYIARTLPEHMKYFEGRKVPLGLSVYGFDVSPKVIAKSAFSIKKSLNDPEKNLRVIENKAPDLNAAQILRNQVVKKGLELLIIRDGTDVVLAQTTAIQDVDAYSQRDFDRPCRDAKVGMLPPKLAQIIINLAKPDKGDSVADILDPFCGTGVVLQEALLRGFAVVGSDIEERMVECSRTNIEWFCKKWMVFGIFAILQADATSHAWSMTFENASIASETYLGRPFSAEPKPDVLNEVMHDVDTIHRKFLKNVASQTKPGFRMCIAVPAWKTRSGFKHLKTLDSLEELGYTRASFVHVSNEELIYHRDGQFVGRELLVLTRK